MKIKKLKLKNIRSYEDQEIVFPEGNVLLSGDVGSGKTSVLLAIEYALFGLQPGQTGLALLRNISQIGEVILEMELNGNNIIIERRLKKNKTVANDYSAITINGDKTEYSITELKTKIISLLGYPPEFIKKNNLLYKYTVYAPQEQMKQIISEDPEVRLNILRNIFGIDKYKRIRENLFLLSANIKEESKVLQGEISSLDSDKNRLSSTKSFITVIEQKILDQNKVIEESRLFRKEIENESFDLENKIREKEKFENEIEKTKVVISSKNENISLLQRELNKLQKDLSDKKEEFNESELIEVINKIESNRQNIERTQAGYIDCLSQLSALNQRKKEALNKKERVFKISICPTCLQDVPIAHKHNIFNETEQLISAVSKEIESFEEKKKVFLAQIQSLKDEKDSLEENKIRLQILKSRIPEINKSHLQFVEVSKNKEILNNDLILLNKHLNSLKETVLGYSKFTHMFKSKQEELKKAFVQEKNAEISFAELKKELELTNREVDILSITISDKEEKRNKLLSLLELNDWLSNQFVNLIEFTERTVMLKLRNEFSKLFSKWFNLLVQDSLEVKLDEKFTPIILQGGIEMDYSFLSGGERTAVALAYRLALNQTINMVMTAIKTKDIIILDEPTEGFSEAQTDKLRDILKELNVKQLMIVSHEQKIETFVDNVIKIKKENNISKVESTVS